MRLRDLTWCWVALAACSAGRAPPSAPARAEPGPPKSESAASYERILGAFVATPTGVVLFDPKSCAETACGRSLDGETISRTADQSGVPALQAAARLNLGAMYWQEGEADRAYQSIRSAQALFAEAGDAVGLAVAHEWLGYMLWKSGAEAPAGDHLALAYQLFERLGDQASAERLASYGRP
jgi:hypothetical protein